MPTPGDLPLQQHVTPFDPIEIGHLRLPNRIVMARMTRSRAAGAGLATTLMARYYAQRASAGLIITEGIQPCVVGQGYPNTPGLHTVEQMRSWRAVTPAVHAAGDRIYDLLTPRALTASEVVATVHQFAQSARNAIIAGFDGVEVHGANGYLVHQFLSASTNLRTDEWGGTIENRIRFAVEVVDAICSAIGAARTALRISPANPFNDMRELDAHAQPVRGPVPTQPAHRAAADRTGRASPHRRRNRRPDLLRRIVSGQPRSAAPPVARRALQQTATGHLLRRHRHRLHRLSTPVRCRECLTGENITRRQDHDDILFHPPHPHRFHQRWAFTATNPSAV
jgi:hypothetical protein